MDKGRVTISGNGVGDEPVRIRSTGDRYTIIALSCAAIAICAFYTFREIRESNDLKRAELDLRRQELKVRQQQCTLDSLRYYAPIKIK